MSLHFMYHPESESLWTVDSEQERDAHIEADPLVCEIDETRYQALHAEINLR